MPSNIRQKALFCWSSGKDSALAIHEVLRAGELEIAALLTTVTEDYGRISMHGVRRELLLAQAALLQLPLKIVSIPIGASNELYEERMRRTLETCRDDGIDAVVFGDIFLDDLRRHREEQLAQVAMKAIFPIWQRDTSDLAMNFIRLGFRAILTCVDSQMLDGQFAGREFDEKLLADLPDGVDPCGENGEFHTFVYDGPIFTAPLPCCRRGEIVVREKRFHFCDVIAE